jgi:hypothetical protein
VSNPDFLPGDEPLDVERNPSGRSGGVIAVSFGGDEMDLIFARAELERKPITAYVHDLVMQHARDDAWFVSLTEIASP